MMKYFMLSCLLVGLSLSMFTMADDSDSDSLGTTIGIDLGTTYVCFCGVMFFFLVLLFVF